MLGSIEMILNEYEKRTGKAISKDALLFNSVILYAFEHLCSKGVDMVTHRIIPTVKDDNFDYLIFSEHAVGYLDDEGEIYDIEITGYDIYR